MSTDLSLHHRRRKPTADELADIPWLPLLQPHERTCAEEVLLVGDALPGDYVCRVGRPAVCGADYFCWDGLLSVIMCL